MRTRLYPFALPLAVLTLLLSGCASLIHSNHQSVRLFSTPGEARVVVDDRIHLSTAGTVTLSRFTDHTAVFEKEGYEPLTLKIERSMSQRVWLNAGCLVFAYWCVKSDREDGGFWTFDDDIHVTLTKRNAGMEPAPPMSPAR